MLFHPKPAFPSLSYPHVFKGVMHLWWFESNMSCFVSQFHHWFFTCPASVLSWRLLLSVSETDFFLTRGVTRQVKSDVLTTPLVQLGVLVSWATSTLTCVFFPFNSINYTVACLCLWIIGLLSIYCLIFGSMLVDIQRD